MWLDLLESAKWSRFWVSVLYGLFILLVVYEIIAGLDRSPRTPMITHVLVREVPGRLTISFLAWALQHFAARYYLPMHFMRSYLIVEAIVTAVLVPLWIWWLWKT